MSLKSPLLALLLMLICGISSLANAQGLRIDLGQHRVGATHVSFAEPTRRSWRDQNFVYFPRGGGGSFTGTLTAQLNAVAAGNIRSANAATALNAISDGYFYTDGTVSSGTEVASLTAIPSSGGPSVSWAKSGDSSGCLTLSGSSVKWSGSCAGGTAPFNVTFTASASGYVSGSITVSAYSGQQYYIDDAAHGCSDSNSGMSSGSPWCSANHPLRCGDFVSLAARTDYAGSEFASGMWGANTCPGNDYAVIVKCVNFDGCKWASFGTHGAMEISANYWVVEDVECDESNEETCFLAQPPTSSTTIHHVGFVNSICDNAGSTVALSCFQANEYNGGTGPSAVDEMIWLGNLAHNGDPGNSLCGSNFSDASPADADSSATTRKYWAFNMSWHTNGGVGCNGAGTTSDDNGFIFDSPNINGYTGQLVVESNLILTSGGTALHIYVNGCCAAGAGKSQNNILRFNTVYDSFQNSGFNAIPWSINLVSQSGSSSYLKGSVTNNLVQETSGAHSGSGTCNNNGDSGCIYPFGQQYVVAASTLIDNNWWDGQASYGSVLNWVVGHQCVTAPNVPTPSPDPSNAACNGDVLGTSPSFVSATVPGAPSCGSATDTQNCMAITIANFKPTASGTAVGGSTVTAISTGAVNSSGTLGQAVADANNMTPFICNVSRTAPASMNPHC